MLLLSFMGSRKWGDRIEEIEEEGEEGKMERYGGMEEKEEMEKDK